MLFVNFAFLGLTGAAASGASFCGGFSHRGPCKNQGGHLCLWKQDTCEPSPLWAICGQYSHRGPCKNKGGPFGCAWKTDECVPKTQTRRLSQQPTRRQEATPPMPMFDIGDCDHLEVTDGGLCVGTKSYGNNHDCQITVLEDMSLEVIDFHVEYPEAELCEPYYCGCPWDYLKVNGERYCDQSPNGENMSMGQTIDWHTDWSVTKDGWKICAAPMTGGARRLEKASRRRESIEELKSTCADFSHRGPCRNQGGAMGCEWKQDICVPTVLKQICAQFSHRGPCKNKGGPLGCEWKSDQCQPQTRRLSEQPAAMERLLKIVEEN